MRFGEGASYAENTELIDSRLIITLRDIRGGKSVHYDVDGNKIDVEVWND